MGGKRTEASMTQSIGRATDNEVEQAGSVVWPVCLMGALMCHSATLREVVSLRSSDGLCLDTLRSPYEDGALAGAGVLCLMGWRPPGRPALMCTLVRTRAAYRPHPCLLVYPGRHWSYRAWYCTVLYRGNTRV